MSLPALRRPVVLLHFPAIFVAVAAAAAILAAAAAAAPIFRSSTGNASVRLSIEGKTGRALTVTKRTSLATDVMTFRDDQLRLAVAGIADLGPPVATLEGSRVTIAAAGVTIEAGLASRTGSLQHVDVLSGGPRPDGIWLEASAADELGVDVGAPLTVALGGLRARTTVAGTYAASRADPYWSALFGAISPTDGGDPPVAVVLAPRDEFLRLETELQGVGIATWTFPVRARALEELTLERATTFSDHIAAFERASKDPSKQLGAALGGPAVSSPILDAVHAAAAGQRTIAGPVQTLSLTGEVVAIFGMIAAGVYGVRRRRVEMRSLDAIGITLGRLVARGTVESTLPILAGGALGWAVTGVAIGRFGPSDLIERSAWRSSSLGAAIPAVLAALIIGGVSAVAARRQAREGLEGRASRRLGGSVLWEIPVLVLAGAALYEIQTRGTSAVSTSGSEVRLDGLLLLFPVLFMAGAAGLIVRAMARALVRLRGIAGRWPVPLYLASRRITTAPRVALLLVTASTLAIGVLAYAGTAVDTIRMSTNDKIMVSVGADVAATTSGPIFPPPPGFGFVTTNVSTIPFVDTVPAGTSRVTVIGVEPDTFEAAAFWDPSFSSAPLSELMRSLGGSQEPLPVIVVGGTLPAVERLRFAGYEAPIREIGSATAFPGQPSGLAVVVSTERLSQLLAGHDASLAFRSADYEVLASGDVRRARAFLVTAGADPRGVVVASDRLETPELRALAWSFVFMELLGLVTVAIALIGLLLYLQARQRARELSYALGRRMGLSSGAHRLAVAVEVAGLLLSAFVIGSTLAFAAAGLVYRQLDPLPDLSPAPILATPLQLLAWIAAGIVACAWLGAWFVQWRAEHADVGAVLRFAE